MRILRLALSLAVPAVLCADEGMWTFNRFPAADVRAKYGVTISPEWIDRVRSASVRLTEGCSGSVVSPQGLVMTNHHCASTCIQQVSSAGKDYSAVGFHARTEAAEVRCPGQEANLLDRITDVTSRVQSAAGTLPDAAANQARKAEIAKIEKECATGDEVRCEVVALHGGGIYELYRYRRFQDVRLVFAPESDAAFFGGDPDNFMFPRYCLDVSFLRIYDKGKPLASTNFLPYSRTGAREGDLTIVSGNPGGTNRGHTVAMLELERDYINPHSLLTMAEYRGMLTMFQTRGAEQRRIVRDSLFSVENSFKAFRGEQQSLLQKSFFDLKRKQEADFRAKIDSDPKLQKEYGGVWDDLARSAERYRAHYLPHYYFELNRGFNADLYRHARRLVRMAEEFAKPNEVRLSEYADARKPEIRQRVLSTAPIYPELEIETLTFALTKLREALSPDDPRVRRILGSKSPRELAVEAVKGSRLNDVAVRKALMEGGRAAIDSSKDSMILLAKQVDPIARAIRKQYEDEVESAQTRALEKLAKARFAAYGSALYPDATFTPRLSYGQVKGWVENGRQVAPFTVFEGAFERATGREPYALPRSWIDSRSKLDLKTPYNFVTTNDVVGGNSGSPMINGKGEIVGLVFDGNIYSLGGNYLFDESVNRTVAVDARAIREALQKIYGADRVLSEISWR